MASPTTVFVDGAYFTTRLQGAPKYLGVDRCPFLRRFLPERLRNRKGLYVRVVGALYGFKRAGADWNAKAHAAYVAGAC